MDLHFKVFFFVKLHIKQIWVLFCVTLSFVVEVSVMSLEKEKNIFSILMLKNDLGQVNFYALFLPRMVKSIKYQGIKS